MNELKNLPGYELSPLATFVNAKQNAVPLNASFELTPRCNMNCGMCYVHLKTDEIKKHGRELEAAEWIELGRQAAKAGSLFLCITGGEPTLHPQFCEIYSALSGMGFIITLQSNLYGIPDECFEIIKKYPPQEIKFTIYGADDETYQKVCGVQNGFTRVMENIRRLKAGGIRLVSVTTVTKDNYKDVEKIAELMKELEIPWVSCAALKKSLRGAESRAEELRLEDSMYANLCDDVRASVEKAQKRKGLKPCELCRDYKTGFWIKWDGRMSFCSFLHEPDIDAARLGFNESWKRLVDFEENLMWPEECRECEISDSCPRCAASIAAESGSIYKVSNGYCKYIKELIKKVNGGEN